MRRSTAIAVPLLLLGGGLLFRLQADRPQEGQEPALPAPPATATENPREPVQESPASTADEGGTSDELRTTCIRALASATNMQEDQLDANGGPQESMYAAARALTVSPNPEHRLAVALLTRSIPPLEGEPLTPYPPPDMTDPLQLWHALISCDRPGAAACPTEELEQALVAVDASNSEAWAAAAKGRYQRGNRERALAALQQAAAAPESRSYWIETVELIDRALIAATDYDYRSRVLLALGASTYAVNDIWAVQTMCEEASASSDSWGRTCEAYGRLIASQHDTANGRETGFFIQQAAARALGYEAFADELGSIEAGDWIRRQSIAFGILLPSDADFLPRYLADARAMGQEAAEQDLLAKELPSLFEQLGLAHCVGVNL